MLYRNTLVVVAFLYAFILACGCSGGETPALPQISDNSIGDVSAPLETRDGSNHPSSHINLGVYEVTLNRDTWTAETSLKRGVTWHAKINDFLFPPFCPTNDCLVIENFVPWVEPNTMQFDGKIKHPFPDPNLDGFDVRGIGILKATKSFPSGNAAYDVILNPDGYTKLWNFSPYVPGSELNPFRAFWTKNDADQHRRRFEGGKSDTRNFIVRFPTSGPEFTFDIAIDASYEFPDQIIPGNPLTDPNSWEPFEVSAFPDGEMLDLQGSEVPFDVYLFDWQNNPSTVTIESPDLFDGSIDLGQPSNHVGFRFDYETVLVNEKEAAAGPHAVLLKAMDTLNGQDPFGMELIAYNIFTINIKHYEGPKPPVAVAHANKEFAFTGELVTFDATDSYDPDGEISTYAWDLDLDGSFDDAFTPTVQKSWDTPGLKCVNVLVTDLDGLYDQLEGDEKPCVQINNPPNEFPVAIHSSFNNIEHTSIGGTVQFYGDKSYDPDGEIVEWNWDFDGDQSWGDSFEVNPQHKFNVAGEYWIWLRVKDDFGATDVSNKALYMEVSGENVPPVAVGTNSCDEPVLNKNVIFTSESYDTDGFIMKWEWDFDDGEGWQDYTSTEGLAIHAFTVAQTYNVQLKVTDSAGGSDTLDAPMQIIAGTTGFTPPAPFDCSGTVSAHIYQLDLKLPGTLSAANTFDVCPDGDGNWVLASGGKLVKLDLWGTIVNANFHSLMGLGPFLLSLDFDIVNHNYAYLYGSPFLSTEVQVINESGTSIATVDAGSPPRAICFDWDGNLLILDSFWEVRFYNADDNFNEDPCVGYKLDAMSGNVFDMATNFRNHGLYILSQGDDSMGQLIWVKHDGTLGAEYDPVFNSSVGPSSRGDIIIDNEGPEGANDCRIEVFGGDATGAVARFDSELNLSEEKRYSFWGIKAACILPEASGDIIIALESCCGKYFDRYIPKPGQW